MSKSPPQSHRDVCAHDSCDNRVAPDEKYCSKRCAEADSKEPDSARLRESSQPDLTRKES